MRRTKGLCLVQILGLYWAASDVTHLLKSSSVFGLGVDSAIKLPPPFPSIQLFWDKEDSQEKRDKGSETNSVGGLTSLHFLIFLPNRISVLSMCPSLLHIA